MLLFFDFLVGTIQHRHDMTWLRSWLSFMRNIYHFWRPLMTLEMNRLKSFQNCFLGETSWLRKVLAMPEKDVLMVTATLKDWKDFVSRLRIGMQDEYFTRSVFRGTKFSQGCFKVKGRERQISLVRAPCNILTAQPCKQRSLFVKGST